MKKSIMAAFGTSKKVRAATGLFVYIYIIHDFSDIFKYIFKKRANYIFFCLFIKKSIYLRKIHLCRYRCRDIIKFGNKDISLEEDLNCQVMLHAKPPVIQNGSAMTVSACLSIGEFTLCPHVTNG